MSDFNFKNDSFNVNVTPVSKTTLKRQTKSFGIIVHQLVVTGREMQINILSKILNKQVFNAMDFRDF